MSDKIYTNDTSVMTVSDTAFVVIRPIGSTPIPEDAEADNGKIRLIQGMFSSPVAVATVNLPRLRELLAAMSDDDETITISTHRIDHPQEGTINAIKITTPQGVTGCLMPVTTRKARKR